MPTSRRHARPRVPRGDRKRQFSLPDRSRESGHAQPEWVWSPVAPEGWTEALERMLEMREMAVRLAHECQGWDLEVERLGGRLGSWRRPRRFVTLYCGAFGRPGEEPWYLEMYARPEGSQRMLLLGENGRFYEADLALPSEEWPHYTFSEAYRTCRVREEGRIRWERWAREMAALEERLRHRVMDFLAHLPEPERVALTAEEGARLLADPEAEVRLEAMRLLARMGRAGGEEERLGVERVPDPPAERKTGGR